MLIKTALRANHRRNETLLSHEISWKSFLHIAKRELHVKKKRNNVSIPGIDDQVSISRFLRFKRPPFERSPRREVTIVDSAETLGQGMIRHLKLQLFWWFREKGVVMMAGVKPVAITGKGLTVLTQQGYRQTIPVDSIVPALPMKPDRTLFDSLQEKVPEVYAVGDCADPRLIVDALADGWRVGKAI